MALLTAFMTYLAKFVVMLIVVAAAFLTGKKVRDIKNKRSSN